jgi:hypothetical protein
MFELFNSAVCYFEISYQLTVQTEKLLLFVSENTGQPPQQFARRIDGSIKLNLFYRNGEMTVMVMHVKDLVKNYFVSRLLLEIPSWEFQKTCLMKGCKTN